MSPARPEADFELDDGILALSARRGGSLCQLEILEALPLSQISGERNRKPSERSGKDREGKEVPGKHHLAEVTG